MLIVFLLETADIAQKLRQVGVCDYGCIVLVLKRNDIAAVFYEHVRSHGLLGRADTVQVAFIITLVLLVVLHAHV